MVAAAKALPTNTMLPLIKLVVSEEGVALLSIEKRKQDPNFVKMYPIETISYGVQDLVYTRVFSMNVAVRMLRFRLRVETSREAAHLRSGRRFRDLFEERKGAG